jgi:myo-inositol-1(or 4)-monophosphatase
MPLPSPDELLSAAVAAARLGATELLAGFGATLDVRTKSHGRDLVTAVDLASERAIVRALAGRWPQIGVLAEEGGFHRPSDEALWIIDPLDGTSNYAHGYPVFSISIGCVDHEGPLVGLVLDPLRDELFTATRHGGAFLNGRRLRVSTCESLEDALFSTGYPYYPAERRRLAGNVFTEVMVTAAANRRGGSAAIDFAYVAAGRSEAHFELGLGPHDIAAGVLLVQEAGGLVEELAPAGYAGWPPGFIATNGSPLHRTLADMIAPPFALAARPVGFECVFRGSIRFDPAEQR